MLRPLIYALPLILVIYALIDCIQTPTDEVRSLPKAAWLILIVFVLFAGPIAWIVAGRARGTGARPVRDRLLPNGPARGPVAPDDDPDFLSRLDAERRRRERERRRREGESDAGGHPSGGAG